MESHNVQVNSPGIRLRTWEHGTRELTWAVVSGKQGWIQWCPGPRTVDRALCEGHTWEWLSASAHGGLPLSTCTGPSRVALGGAPFWKSWSLLPGWMMMGEAVGVRSRKCGFLGRRLSCGASTSQPLILPVPKGCLGLVVDMPSAQPSP